MVEEGYVGMAIQDMKKKNKMIEEARKIIEEEGLHFGGTSKEEIIIETNSLPIGNHEGIEYRVAKKIADKYNINLDERDNSRGSDDPPTAYWHVFESYVSKHAESEIRSSIEKLKNAKNELEEKINSAVEAILSV